MSEDRLRLLESAFAEFRGEVKGFMTTSHQDRVGLHNTFERGEAGSRERHEQLMGAIRDAGKEARAGLETLAREIAVERKRIDAWENKAAGAGFLARYLPAGLWSGAGAVVAWVASNWRAMP